MKIFSVVVTPVALILLSLLIPLSFAHANETNVASSQHLTRAPNATANVTIVDFDFQPATITINVNDSVQWSYPSGITHHTSTSDTGLWDSASIFVGQSFSHQFTATGYFAYHCNVHASMHGVVRVVAPNFFPVISNSF